MYSKTAEIYEKNTNNTNLFFIVVLKEYGDYLTIFLMDELPNKLN